MIISVSVRYKLNFKVDSGFGPPRNKDFLSVNYPPASGLKLPLAA
jgi:hypothetical protein